MASVAFGVDVPMTSAKQQDPPEELEGPRELRVPADHRTIQKAIQEARDGDTVIVADGTYPGEKGFRDLDFVGKRIVVRSESGDPQRCVLDINPRPPDGSRDDKGSHRGFLFHGSETEESVLLGFTIRNGRVTGKEGGGGILCRAGGTKKPASPRIERCIVAGCKAGGNGGGIACEGGSAPLLQDCVVEGNLAGGSGGGLAVSGGSHPKVQGGRFVGNTAELDGGGVWEFAIDSPSSATFKDLEIRDNSAGRDGGGAWLRDSRTQFPFRLPLAVPPPQKVPAQFHRCTIRGNAAGESGRGGGIFVDATIEGFAYGLGGKAVSGVIFDHGWIVGNSAGTGGGACLAGGLLGLTNAVVNANAASRGPGLGGGVAVLGPHSRFYAVFCTMYRNAASTLGASIYLDGPTNVSDVEATVVEVTDSILFGDPSAAASLSTSPIGRNSARKGLLRVSFSYVQFQASTDYPLSELGMITAEPGFAEDQPEVATYRLRSSSPSVSRGREYHFFLGTSDDIGPCGAANVSPYTPFLPWPRDIDGGCRLARRKVVDAQGAVRADAIARADVGAYEVQ